MKVSALIDGQYAEIHIHKHRKHTSKGRNHLKLLNQQRHPLQSKIPSNLCPTRSSRSSEREEFRHILRNNSKSKQKRCTHTKCSKNKPQLNQTSPLNQPNCSPFKQLNCSPSKQAHYHSQYGIKNTKIKCCHHGQIFKENQELKRQNAIMNEYFQYLQGENQKEIHRERSSIYSFTDKENRKKDQMQNTQRPQFIRKSNYQTKSSSRLNFFED